jgi:hypothetical protein
LLEQVEEARSGVAVPQRRAARTGRAAERREKFLDTRTKSASVPLYVDHSTGEILREYDPTLKWQLQAVARVALGVFDPSRTYKEGHRIRVCMRHMRGDRNEVEVLGAEDRRAYYAGLMACGSVWACSVCAPKIQAVRALEVRQAIDEWTRRGGHVVMLTQTIPHARRDVLETLLTAFTEALRKFKQWRAYARAVRAYGIVGSIRALEVTHGGNGWHPHAHTVLFLDPCAGVDFLPQMQVELFELWQSAAARAGVVGELSPEAFTLQDAAHVRRYVTKMGQEYQWNAEHELVKAHSKTGGRGGRSPFDLLRSYLWDNADRQALALFAEYAWCFHGRRQLVWSNGLKRRLLGSEGATDQQVADSIGEADPVLARITLGEWAIIRRHNLQGQLLQVVQEHGREGLRHLLDHYAR